MLPKYFVRPDPHPPDLALHGVLVVEPKSLVRKLLIRSLERNGLEPWVAADGYEAVELYWDHKQDIAAALLDVDLPGLDGPETLEALRSLNSDILACFMNGVCDGVPADELRQAGAAHVFHKPVQPAHVARVLLRLIQNRPHVDHSPASQE